MEDKHSVQERATNMRLVPELNDWLSRRLEEKNELTGKANTRYLFHGTSAANVQHILKEGLSAKFSMTTNVLYGKGIYLTDSCCKADQYTQGIGPSKCILLCRVLLGRVHTLPMQDQTRAFAPDGFHSCMARQGKTFHTAGVQLHNEVIVYHDTQVYPEFLLQYEYAREPQSLRRRALPPQGNVLNGDVTTSTQPRAL